MAPERRVERASLHLAPDRLSHGPQPRNEIGKNVRDNRLFAIAFGELGRVVHFNHERVGSGGDSRQCHLRHEVPQTNSVRRIYHDGEVRLRFQKGDGVEIKSVPRGVFESTNAAFAQEHVHVSFAQNVLGAHHQVADRRAKAALEQDR